MADPASYGTPVRDIDQALIALKKGTQLIKYSRKGKPKFCPFRLSPDETTLIWYSRGEERNLKLSSVSRIIPGQRTPVFKRFLRPEKEYLSFSLIYNNGERSLDLICKDKFESEAWLAGLKALISTGQPRSRRVQSDISDLYGIGDFPQDSRPFGAPLEFTPGPYSSRISADFNSIDYPLNITSSDVGSESANMQIRTSSTDGFRISVSSAPSCSSQGSGPDDIESLGDVYVWGEIWSDGGPIDGNGCTIPIKNEALTPRPLESNVVLDVLQISCGVRHVALVTRQGEVFTWGEECGGRLGHGIEKDFSRPQLVEFLAVTNVEFVACGEFHTCAVSTSGDLYTWGDGIQNAGLLGHGNNVSHWLPKRVSGPLEGQQVLSIACGSWHSALVTSTGRLFTFGDGLFGALGHGDRESVTCPREVQSLNGLKTITVACGVWHTAAIIDVTNQSGSNVMSGKLFTWGDGDKYRLGHGNKETYLLPTCVSALIDYNVHQLACGHHITVALTTSGHVFTMGSNTYGQLGNPQSDGRSPALVQDKLVGEFVEQIACGAHHVAVLTSRSEMFTWGRGANGRLGHGDLDDCDVPKLVEALKDRHIKNIACGSSYTASICIHKWVSGADQSVCTGCRQAFGFTRKRHHCYNCGLVHCHACSSKKALRAALAPTPGKPHRVCDPCYLKLKKAAEPGKFGTINRRMSSPHHPIDYSSRVDREDRRSSRILLSPNMEPVKYLEIKSGKPGNKYDSYSIVRASQVPSLLQLKDIAFPSSFSAIQYALNPVATSAPQHLMPQRQSQSNSRPASPYSRRPSPPHSAAPVLSRGVIDSLKKTNDLLNQEVSKLQNQVKSLKQKSEVQDMEILKLKKTAQEAASLAAERSSKCKIAMQAIKTITVQLNEITDKMPPEICESESFKEMHSQIEAFLDTIQTQASEDSSAMPPESTLEDHNDAAQIQDTSQSVDGTQQESSGSSVSDTKGVNHPSTEGVSGMPEAARREGRKEVIEQFEPGVYVTLILLADGTKIFKRVRFSKRRFASQQAEEWWRENKDRLLRKYSPPPRVNSVQADVTAAEPPAEENNSTSQSS
ncbi:PH, RCC1 and FYVE domains-containing 1-like [Olea europaea subsp. europaea]|uniref:PH, RCC1 and FYVE domains-containing 1-like n=1 Tax=Olea europaea subsp. europaea TaxID=158383 RepID=A0A8S0R846_OLEEU|nr:PH, RCC1 and FYVE domains-containing 1-like [Olea europaea subsp. europaea]